MNSLIKLCLYIDSSVSYTYDTSVNESESSTADQKKDCQLPRLLASYIVNVCDN